MNNASASVPMSHARGQRRFEAVEGGTQWEGCMTACLNNSARHFPAA